MHCSFPVVGLLLVASSAFADISLSTTVYGMGQLCAASGTDFAQCSFSGLDPNPWYPNPDYSGTLAAYANFGYLGADMYVESSLDHLGTSKAISAFTDDLTVAGSGNGFIQYGLTVTRDFVTWGSGYEIAVTQGGSSMDQFTTAPCCVSGDNHGTITYQTSLYPIMFGNPFALSIRSTAQVWLEPGEFGWNHLGIALTGLQVYDTSMHPIDAVVGSRSGTLYPTPEPASVILIGTAFFMTGFIIKRKHPDARRR